jgi:hypothetical protein
LNGIWVVILYRLIRDQARSIFATPLIGIKPALPLSAVPRHQRQCTAGWCSKPNAMAAAKHA